MCSSCGINTEFFILGSPPHCLSESKEVTAHRWDRPRTYLTHELVHALSPLQNQVVLGWEGMIMSSALHLIEVLPVFYLKEAHKEQPELLFSFSRREVTLHLLHLSCQHLFNTIFWRKKKNHMGFSSTKSLNHSLPFRLKYYCPLSHFFTLYILVLHEERSQNDHT